MSVADTVNTALLYVSAPVTKDADTITGASSSVGSGQRLDSNISFNLIKDRLKEIIKETDKVVIIPWAFATEIDADTLDKYFKEKKKDKYVNPLLELGIKQSNITVLNCYKDTEEYMIDKIKNSNVLVLPGGNPEMFYNKVVKHRLLEVIKNYDKVVIGESAGTELQLNNYFITAKTFSTHYATTVK